MGFHMPQDTRISPQRVSRCMFGSRVGFSGSTDRMALFLVTSNPRWRPAAILGNFEWPYFRNGSFDPLAYSAHRAVIFAIGQLSCLYRVNKNSSITSESGKVGFLDLRYICLKLGEIRVMVNGSRFYRALESASIASALSTALAIYPYQIRVHQR